RAFGLGPGAAPAESLAKLEVSIVDDLRANSGAALIVPGPALRHELHALVHALNHLLEGAGRTFTHIEPVAFEPVSHVHSIQELASAIKAGHVRTLLILDGNPAYDAPSNLDFATLLKRV